MKQQQINDLLATLDMLEAIAGEVIDTVASARVELEHPFEKIEQSFERSESA